MPRIDVDTDAMFLGSTYTKVSGDSLYLSLSNLAFKGSHVQERETTRLIKSQECGKQMTSLIASLMHLVILSSQGTYTPELACTLSFFFPVSSFKGTLYFVANSVSSATLIIFGNCFSTSM